MTRRYVKELTNGESVDEIFLVAEKQLRSNRQGQLYLQLDLRDRSGTISARLWNASEEQARSFETGDYVKAKGKVQLFQGSVQLILWQLEPTPSESLDLEEFLPQASRGVAEMTARLRQLLMGVSDPHLRALAECFLIDDQFLHRFTSAPAGVRVHHAYQGGLLEHVLTMMEVADRIADLYPALNRDLLILGIFLHDVGKILELDYGRAFGYTDQGQLIGHLVLGIGLLDEKVRQTVDLTGERFPDELLMRLKHMIVSHHGPPEFGSPKPPMTPEAIALHYLDNFDAKVFAYCRQIRDDPAAGSTWTSFDPSVGHRLFKGSPPPETDPTDEDAF
ncbi:3'-5' exoribonuclease YhaM family protein [Tautonia marina]|uniref:3'-5' exoribonuclease YhaM family protein n=1 Tax=Tautonia marina TaxID=2653855 RepID=UPI0012609D3D|nr:HD domain-containing protein [Tautonia marina]